MSWIPPADIDPEVRALCIAMNKIPGITTTDSCCGHGHQPLRVWFFPDTEKAMLPLLYYLAWCHSGEKGWRAEIHTDCGRSHVTYVVEGPAGAYEAADKIAALIEQEFGEN